MTSLRPPPTQDDLDTIREGVRSVVTRFDDDYWLSRDDDGVFPHEFHRAMADAGWLGITMPEEYGGAGFGVTEAAVMMHEVASHGGGMTAASTVHINLFGPHPIVVKGTPEQRAVVSLDAGGDIGLTVAYHAACSLRHGQKVVDAPRRLLAGTGYTVRTPIEAHLCCGSAGTYNILQPEIAAVLGERKAANSGGQFGRPIWSDSTRK